MYSYNSANMQCLKNIYNAIFVSINANNNKKWSYKMHL